MIWKLCGIQPPEAGRVYLIGSLVYDSDINKGVTSRPSRWFENAWMILLQSLYRIEISHRYPMT
jgi:hypothetical protein